MEIQMFSLGYFVALILCVGMVVGLYFILRNKSQKIQKIVLWSFLFLGIVLHFLKFLIPPYSTDLSRLYRDSWFINICGANIALFPIFFLCKDKRLKDYMFYLGVISGILSILVPLEPIQKANQAGEWLDIIRFYYHHTILWGIPLLMVVFKLHKLDYKRILWTPTIFLGVLLFIMLNQILQSELGFIPLRNNDFFGINYKNSSMIWAPTGEIGKILSYLCPNIFKYVPVGEHAGEAKYWPWFWMIVPVYVLITPLSFGLSMIFDHKHFATDCKNLKVTIKQKFNASKLSKKSVNNETEQFLKEKTNETISEKASETINETTNEINESKEQTTKNNKESIVEDAKK